jgi:hypothetical protein
MSDDLETLVALRHNKIAEILAFVAKSYELGDFHTLDASKQENLRDEVEGLIEEHNEAISAAEPIEMASLDARLNWSEVGRLLNELHEIDEEILDIQDEDIDRNEN